MSAIWVIASNTLRQTIRQRLYLNIVIFGVAMLLLSMVMAQITLGVPSRVVRSVGLSGATITVDLMALLVAVTLVHQEIDRKTLFVVLTRPIRRSEYLIGRYLGLFWALLIALVGFSVVFVLTLSSVRGEVQFQDFVALLMIIPEAAIIGAFGLILSTFSTPTLSAGMGLGFWIACATIDDLVKLLQRGDEQLRSLAEGVSFALPNLARLNFREAAVYGFDIATRDVILALAYGALWSVVLVGISVAILNRREMV